MFCSNGMEKRINILFVEDNLIEAENGEVALELLNKDKITTD